MNSLKKEFKGFAESMFWLTMGSGTVTITQHLGWAVLAATVVGLAIGSGLGRVFIWLISNVRLRFYVKADS